MARNKRDDADEDHQYPIDEEWRSKVLKIVEAKRGAQAKLAREIDCSPGTLNELLKNGKRSHLVPKINAALGWDPPTLPATGSTDQHEIEVFLKKMGRSGRAIFEHLKTIAADDPSKLSAVEGIVAALAKKPSSND